MNIFRLAGQMRVDEGSYEMTKFHEEGTSVDVPYNVTADELIYVTSHPYLQNNPKKTGRTN